MYYIGLDVHERTISYCVKDGSGKIHTEGAIPSTRFDLDRWMKIPLTGDKSEQCPVMCYHHDGSDFEYVSTSLDNFLNGIEKSIKS